MSANFAALLIRFIDHSISSLFVGCDLKQVPRFTLSLTRLSFEIETNPNLEFKCMFVATMNPNSVVCVWNHASRSHTILMREIVAN